VTQHQYGKLKEGQGPPTWGKEGDGPNKCDDLH